MHGCLAESHKEQDLLGWLRESQENPEEGFVERVAERKAAIQPDRGLIISLGNRCCW